VAGLLGIAPPKQNEGFPIPGIGETPAATTAGAPGGAR